MIKHDNILESLLSFHYISLLLGLSVLFVHLSLSVFIDPDSHRELAGWSLAVCKAWHLHLDTPQCFHSVSFWLLVNGHEVGVHIVFATKMN